MKSTVAPADGLRTKCVRASESRGDEVSVMLIVGEVRVSGEEGMTGL
jgi:hypothetical protein